MRRLRESKGYSIRQLALRSEVSFGQISKIENGHRGIPKPETIQKLSRGLGVDYDYLMSLAGYITNDDTVETKELTEFLKKANVLYHGTPLTEEDKKRVEAVLTGLFWDAYKRSLKGEEKNSTSKNGGKDN